jgi:hypothetical protein
MKTNGKTRNGITCTSSCVTFDRALRVDRTYNFYQDDIKAFGSICKTFILLWTAQQSAAVNVLLGADPACLDATCLGPCLDFECIDIVHCVDLLIAAPVADTCNTAGISSSCHVHHHHCCSGTTSLWQTTTMHARAVHECAVHDGGACEWSEAVTAINKHGNAMLQPCMNLQQPASCLPRLTLTAQTAQKSQTLGDTAHDPLHINAHSHVVGPSPVQLAGDALVLISISAALH